MRKLEQYIEENPFFKNRNISYHIDSLTKILQRGIILDYIRYLIQEKKVFTLFLIDLDNFKYINDTQGHLFGDDILKRSIYELEKVIRKNNGILGRIGGDEFLGVVENVSSYEEVWDIAQKMNKSVSSNIYTASGVSMTVTMGVARYPLNASSYEELFNCCDKALYRGKNKGRNCFIIYKPELHQNMDSKDLKFNFSSTTMLKSIFDILTSPRCDIEANIISLFKFLTEYMDLDSICINYEEKMNYHYTNGKIKNIFYIEEAEYHPLIGIEGIAIMNQRTNLTKYPRLYRTIMDQDIRSFIVIECLAGNRHFGYLRVDMAGQRIWSKEEKDSLLVAAKAIGVILAKGDYS